MLQQWRAGFRVSEALDLEVRDMSLDTASPTLRVRSGKGGKSRLVPVDPELHGALSSTLAYGDISQGRIIEAHPCYSSNGMVDTCEVISYTYCVILSFRHRGLARLYERGDRRRIPPGYVDKVERILARLDVAAQPGDLDLPGYMLHRLRGEFSGLWSVRVSGNWRIVFRFEGGNARDVDLVDYH